MKKILLMTVVFSLCTLSSFAECNCNKTKYEKATVTQCQVKPIAGDNTLQFGLSAGQMITNQTTSNYVAVTLRFKQMAKKINADLSIKLENGQLIVLKLWKARLAHVGNSYTSESIFHLSSSQIAHLKLSKIKSVHFTLTDGIVRTLSAKTNQSILQVSLRCLKN